MKVIGSAGSDEKVALVKSLGADVAFNYKTTDTNEILAKEGPINVWVQAHTWFANSGFIFTYRYWDNVGGTTLDAALGNAAFYARFIECGMVSGYNSTEGFLMKVSYQRHLRSDQEDFTFFNVQNLWSFVSRRISLDGFIENNLSPKWKKEFYEIVPKKLVSGEIKYQEDIVEGLEHAGQALLDVKLGKNLGKKCILVAKD
jgi:NADPH-dependent curcumin reductase CurA